MACGSVLTLSCFVVSVLFSELKGEEEGMFVALLVK